MTRNLATCTALALVTIIGSAFSVSRTASANASIAVTSNSFPGENYALTITQDAQGDIESMTFIDNGKNTTPITVAELEKGPQPLYTRDGKTIISLSLDSDFNPQKGGYIELKYVTDAIWGDFKDFRILVDVEGDDIVLTSDPNPQDKNSDKNSYTGVFNSLFFQGGTFGVTAVTPSESVEASAPSPIASAS